MSDYAKFVKLYHQIPEIPYARSVLGEARVALETRNGRLPKRMQQLQRQDTADTLDALSTQLLKRITTLQEGLLLCGSALANRVSAVDPLVAWRLRALLVELLYNYGAVGVELEDGEFTTIRKGAVLEPANETIGVLQRLVERNLVVVEQVQIRKFAERSQSLFSTIVGAGRMGAQLGCRFREGEEVEQLELLFQRSATGEPST